MIWTYVWKDTLLTCANWLKYPKNISIFTRQRSISVVKFYTARIFFVNAFYFRDEIRKMIHARIYSVLDRNVLLISNYRTILYSSLSIYQ